MAADRPQPTPAPVPAATPVATPTPAKPAEPTPPEGSKPGAPEPKGQSGPLPMNTVNAILIDVAAGRPPEHSKLTYTKQMLDLRHQIEDEWEAWHSAHPDSMLDAPNELPEMDDLDKMPKPKGEDGGKASAEGDGSGPGGSKPDQQGRHVHVHVHMGDNAAKPPVTTD